MAKELLKLEKCPVFLSIDFEQFSPDLKEILERIHFKSSSEEELKECETYKRIHIKRASHKVLQSLAQGDGQGNESMRSKGTYSVYRYLKVGILIFGSASREWEMEVMDYFGEQEWLMATRVFLGRSLGLALVNYGKLVLWGDKGSGGLRVLRKYRSKGKFLVLDMVNYHALSYGEEVPLRRPIPMEVDMPKIIGTMHPSEEELYAFLLARTVFLDSLGIEGVLDQKILELTKISHPKFLAASVHAKLLK